MWLPLCLGALLRLWGLGGQVLGGDELHTLRAMIGTTLGQILTTFRVADPCLPLTGLYRLLSEFGIPLSEWTLRAPVLLAGVATILVLPCLLRPWLRRDQRTVFAWLLALSPLLVLYSRIARPYAITVLLSFAALVAFLRWWRGDGWRFGIAYAGLASLCGYFHLLTLPLLASPFLFAAVQLAAHRSASSPSAPTRFAGLRRLSGLGVLTLAALATWVVPATPSLRVLLRAKGGEGSVDPGVLSPLLQQAIGTPWWPVALLVATGAMWGWWRLSRENGQLTAFVATAAVGQIVGLWVVAPLGLDQPVILSRYLLVLMPWLLLGLAVGLVDVAARLGAREDRRPVLRASLLAATLGTLFVSGPFVARTNGLTVDFYAHGSFVHSRDALAFEEPLPRLAAEAVPGVYHQLRDTPEPGEAVLEVPVRLAWRFAHAPYLYQRFHGLPVLAGTVDQGLCAARWSLRSRPCARVDVADPLILDVERLRALGVRFLVVHLEPQAEERDLMRSIGRRMPRERHDLDRWETVRDAAWQLFRAFRRDWGRPHVREAHLAMWDLSQLEPAAGRDPADEAGL